MLKRQIKHVVLYEHEQKNLNTSRQIQIQLRERRRRLHLPGRKERRRVTVSKICAHFKAVDSFKDDPP